MFYEKQTAEQRESYKSMLNIIGKLTRLFSDADEPYLPYRAHENIFSKYFPVKNNARHDDSADAYTDSLGIGLKTWVGQDNQKVAEFGRLRPQYANLEGIQLVKRIAEYRNERIRVTMNAHGLAEMVYHIVKRLTNEMQIYEAEFEPIDIPSIRLIPNRGNSNSVYFTDNKHTYHFSKSKNTLYMIFDQMELLDSFSVDIEEDPYTLLQTLFAAPGLSSDKPILTELTNKPSVDRHNQLCLRLYSVRNGVNYVPLKSGLNQWNGSRTVYRNGVFIGERPRDENELYMPYPKQDRDRKVFFPPRDTPFDLMLPDGQWIKAKVCQDGSKAIMSNPNNLLGKWLLRDVFNLPVGKVVKYEMLEIYDVDCVIFTKIDDLKYTVDFGNVGTYESFYEQNEE